MKKENIYQFTWYTDTGNIFKREKNGSFEKSNKSELATFMIDNASTFKMKRTRSKGVKSFVTFIINKN